MTRRYAFLLALILGLSAAVAAAQELKPIELPKPQTDGGRPLMQVLRDRQSMREFKSEKLPLPVLSNLLWAAFGVNRPDSGKRTAPSGRNQQEIDIYVALAEGLYVYDAKAHRLNPVVAEDVRGATGGQDFVKQAPLNLVYVADFTKTGNATGEDRIFNVAVDTGFIAQNVYLFCASEGLGTVVRGGIDRTAMAKALRLRPDQRITVAQTVGYPK
jgi:SagB-type dehydrogenase family enzyme